MVHIPVDNGVRPSLIRERPKFIKYHPESRYSICTGPPPVDNAGHRHAYGYNEPYGCVYKCGLDGCNSPVELVIVSK